MARGEGRKDRTSGTFGSVDKQPGGYRARYYGPDKRRHKASVLFPTQKAAREWLALRHSEIVRNAWMPPEAQHAGSRLTFADYAERWLAQRDLQPRTREHYRKLLDDHLLPAFGTIGLTHITADHVRAWHAGFTKTTPTLRSHCYGLLRTIFGDAVREGKAPANPCVIRGAGSTRRAHQVRPATATEVEKLTQAMPDQYRAMILLACWCALRFGELTELRRRDVDLDADLQRGVVRVQRAVVRTDEGFQVTSPKSEAGIRTVAIPPHLVPLIQEHLACHVGQGPDVLLFPAQHGGHLAPATLYRRFYAARDAAGRPDLRFHDLRHTGAVLAAQEGATVAELMGRLGHSTPQAAMRYQHAAAGRDQLIADAMSKRVAGRPAPSPKEEPAVTTDELLTYPQAAERLGVSAREVQRMVRNEQMGYVLDSRGRRRIPESAL